MAVAVKADLVAGVADHGAFGGEGFEAVALVWALVVVGRLVGEMLGHSFR